MGTTKIEWCDKTWSPITGCSPVSEGCNKCWARRMATRFRGRFGYPADEPFRVTFHEKRLDEPMRWRKPQRIFVCSMADLFHEDVPIAWQWRIVTTLRHCPQHTFLLLTKRPERMADVVRSLRSAGWVGVGKWPEDYPHVHLGVTVENDRNLNRIMVLLSIPAAKRFVSCEPMLGPVDFAALPDVQDKHGVYVKPLDLLDWVIVGCETGPGARPTQPEWIRSVYEQCRAAGVPLFIKSYPVVGRVSKDPMEWPEWARVREFPK